MTCKNCGFEIKENEKFCMNCGALAEDSIEREKSESNQDEESDEANEEQENLNQNDNIVLTNYEIDKADEETFKAKRIKTFTISAAVLIVLAIIITGFAFLKDMTATKELEKAIEEKSAVRVNQIYDEARGNNSKIKKYDAVIGQLIDDMIADINAYNFDDDALSNSYGAFDNYAIDRWGTLMMSYSTDSMAPSVSSANAEKWARLGDLESSKYNYCGALYEYKTENDYQEAISYFSKVIESDSEFENAKTMTGECVDLYIGTVLEAVEEKIAQDDISGGLDLLTSAKEYLDECGLNSEEISNKINETLVNYAESYAQKAEEEFKNHNVDAAMGNMEVALELQPENADYKIKYDTYQQYIPFKLYLKNSYLNIDEPTGFYTGGIHFDRTITSNENTEMNHTINWGTSCVNDTEAIYVTYNLAGKYDTITGQVFFPRNHSTQYINSYFVVYGDGKLLYTSPKMTPESLTQNIEFHVSGVQKLKIEFRGTNSGCVSNLTAQKAFPE